MIEKPAERVDAESEVYSSGGHIESGVGLAWDQGPTLALTSQGLGQVTAPWSH